MAQKNLRYSVKEKKASIEPRHSEILVYRQCELLGLSRSSYYYSPREESELNLTLTNLIMNKYTRTPFYGVPKMTAWLKSKAMGLTPRGTASYACNGACIPSPG